jgi:hypothetical protein
MLYQMSQRHLNLLDIITNALGIINNCEDAMDITQIYVFSTRKNTINEQIKRLRVDKPRKCKNIKAFCTICCENVKNTEYIRKLPCLHHFHKKCVDKWFVSSMKEKEEVTCPLCRKTIEVVHYIHEEI